VFFLLILNFAFLCNIKVLVISLAIFNCLIELMNLDIRKLSVIAEKKHRLIIGLMSGTSLDGLDIALCKIEGSGQSTKVKLLAFETTSYPDDFKKEIKKICFVKTVDLEQICLLNKKLGVLHAKYINDFIATKGYKNHEIDLIASHGQTIYHSPAHLRKPDEYGNATLQIGDADHLAVHTGIITISDFRQKNIAQGEEGAPLALYGDYLLFKSDLETRVLLNIGGIANFTILKPQTNFEEVVCSDLGPGNTLMDQFIQQNFKPLFFDKNAEIARKGKVIQPLLTNLLTHNFFKEEFPKTTGPELFNLKYVEEALNFIKQNDFSKEDILATLNRFTAETIAIGVKKFILNDDNAVIYLSGGGAHNPLIVANLKWLLPNVLFKNTRDLGINPDAKEAILFALLANETIAGDPSFFSIHTLSLGKISLPN
jgi:anhydro-N-acetylmuramic acid kinase